jgi:hypothetical protein
MRPVSCVWFVGLFALLVFGWSGGGALAAAFLDPAGQGEIIVTTSFTDSADAFDASGRLVPVASYRKFELAAWTDYGLTDWLTLIVAPSADDIVNSNTPTSAYRGLGLTEAGVRVPIVQAASSILSLQATGLVPGSFDRSDAALAGTNSFQSDARLLYGTGFELCGMASFVDVEAGYRWYEIGPGEVRADLTFGIRPVPTILLLAQSFTIVSVGPGVAYAPNLRSDKLEASAVYDFNKAWSAQLGAFATVAAVNARREQGLVTAVWYRF